MKEKGGMPTFTFVLIPVFTVTLSFCLIFPVSAQPSDDVGRTPVISPSFRKIQIDGLGGGDELEFFPGFIWNHTSKTVVQDGSQNESASGRFGLDPFVAGCQDFPYAAQFQIYMQHPDDPTNELLFGFCPGVLVSPTTVITAARCLVPCHGYKIVYAWVVLGAHTLARNPEEEPCPSQIQVIPIYDRYIYPHEGYNPATGENDLCSVTLDVCATLGFHTKPILLAPPAGCEGEPSFDGAMGLRTSGWGTRECQGTYLSNQLMYMNSKIVHAQECGYQYGEKFHPSSMICARGFGKDGCCNTGNDGDLGNGLEWCALDGHLRLVGLLIRYPSYPYGSWCEEDLDWSSDETTKSCTQPVYCNPCLPNVFLRISFYHDWITQRILIGDQAKNCYTNIFAKCPQHSCTEWCADKNWQGQALCNTHY